MADSPAARELRTLPVPGGPAVAEVFGALEDVLADRGPALLPVPADDPARTRILARYSTGITSADELPLINFTGISSQILSLAHRRALRPG